MIITMVKTVGGDFGSLAITLGNVSTIALIFE